jgi:FkbM family methyltransferase
MTATREDIVACFRLFLGRSPHEEESAPHFRRIGDSLDSVVSSFLQSPEFRSRALLCPNEAEVVTLDGFRIYVAKDDRLIAPGIRTGYEPEVTRAFLQHRGDGAVIDIGANCGYFSFLAASRGATVYAFEPMQRNVRLLHAGVALNNFSGVNIIPAAASDSMGTVTIGGMYTNGIVKDIPADSRAALVADYVLSVRIDDIVPESTRVSLIKIDVEGHESRAISGAAETIRRSRPVIISEFSPSLLGSPVEYLDLLRSFGYGLSAIGMPGVIGNAAFLASAPGTDHIDIVALPL